MYKYVWRFPAEVTGTHHHNFLLFTSHDAVHKPRNKTVRVHRIGLQQTRIRYSAHVLKVPFAIEQVAMEISVLNIHILTQQLLAMSTLQYSSWTPSVTHRLRWRLRSQLSAPAPSQTDLRALYVSLWFPAGTYLMSTGYTWKVRRALGTNSTHANKKIVCPETFNLWVTAKRILRHLQQFRFCVLTGIVEDCLAGPQFCHIGLQATITDISSYMICQSY
jgi:hypothetical protein